MILEPLLLTLTPSEFATYLMWNQNRVIIWSQISPTPPPQPASVTVPPRGSRTFFVREGPILTGFLCSLLVDEGPWGHHRPARETPFQWRFAGVPLIAQH